MGTPMLAGCPEKSDGSSSETETTATTATTATDADSTTATTGSDTSTTTGTVPTSGGDPEETTAAATGTTAAPLEEHCAFLIGKKFVSQQQWPCGPPRDPNMPGPLCPDRVSFKEDTFSYQSSDYGFSGMYTCKDGVIAGVADDDQAYEGIVDAVAAKLVWDGNPYNVE